MASPHTMYLPMGSSLMWWLWGLVLRCMYSITGSSRCCSSGCLFSGTLSYSNLTIVSGWRLRTFTIRDIECGLVSIRVSRGWFSSLVLLTSSSSSGQSSVLLWGPSSEAEQRRRRRRRRRGVIMLTPGDSWCLQRSQHHGELEPTESDGLWSRWSAQHN